MTKNTIKRSRRGEKKARGKKQGCAFMCKIIIYIYVHNVKYVNYVLRAIYIEKK